MKILLVEDSPSDALFAIRALKKHAPDSEVFHVIDGVEAMDFLHQRAQRSDGASPDLILLDLNLPRMNGHEVLREIKSDHALRRIPVVVLTTSYREPDIFAAYDSHTNAYLVKPVDLSDFDRIVKVLTDFWVGANRLPA